MSPGAPSPTRTRFERRARALLALLAIGLGLGLWASFALTELPSPLDTESPALALGTALVPSDLDPQAAREHHWRSDRRYSLAYGISGDIRARLAAAQRQLARSLQYQRGSGTAFAWNPPPSCRYQPWKCVFQSLGSDARAEVAPLTELFRRLRTEWHLDARALSKVVVTFVQNMDYRLPTDAFFGVLPPPLVAADGWGDCDSKALLAAVILKQLGIDAVILYSAPLEHAALGVALPGPQSSFSSRGRRYAYVECTDVGWPIGTIPPRYDRPALWEVIHFAL